MAETKINKSQADNTIYTQDNLVAGTNIEIAQKSLDSLVYSNFSAENSIIINQNKLAYSNPWQITVKTKFSSTGEQGNSYLLGGNGDNRAVGLGVNFGTIDGSSLVASWGLSGDGSTWSIQAFTTASSSLQFGTWYIFRFSWSGTVYKFEASADDGTTWETLLSTNSSTPLYYDQYNSLGKRFQLGNRGSNESGYFKGLIDIRGCNFNMNGNYTFRGATAVAGTDFTVEGNPTVSEYVGSVSVINNTQPAPDLSAYLQNTATGKIPAERLGTGYDATKTQVLKNVNGTLTWVDE